MQLGRKFLPHNIVMVEFPVSEIDNFLANGKKWSKLMQIEGYSLNDDAKSAMLRAAYTMGVFGDSENDSNPDAFTNMLKIFSKDQDGISEYPEMTPDIAHQLFGSFVMRYDSDFAKFITENLHEIISNPELIKMTGTIQRDFQRIKAGLSGKGLTLEGAVNFVKENPYTNINIGNEILATRCKEAGYSQADFDELQVLYEKSLEREASGIPRVSGKAEGELSEYKYEMLSLEDPLALTIGTMTDCCQEIHGAGEASMLHSVLSEDGRVFVVRDKEDRIVAQSWVWRNGDTICFDNIEVPKRIQKMYKRERGEKESLPEDVLKVYEVAAKQIMEIDKKTYESIPDEEITDEEREEVVAGKTTIGLGYNDIQAAIMKRFKEKVDRNPRMVEPTETVPNPYTDADKQYIIEERANRKKDKNFEARRIYQDNVGLFDSKTFPQELVVSILKMDEASGREKLTNSDLANDLKIRENPRRIIEELAYEYDFSDNKTLVLATSRTALILEESDDHIKIGDLLTVPLKDDLTEEQKAKGKRIIKSQLKRSLKQLLDTNKKIDVSNLPEESQTQINEIIESIAKDKDEK